MKKQKIKYQVAKIKPIQKSIECTCNHEPQIKTVSKKKKTIPQGQLRILVSSPHSPTLSHKGKC